MKATVWIVDDCPVIRRVTKVRITGLGAEVDLFASGSAAIASWVAGHHHRPTVIFLDQNMPGPSGIETGRILRDAGYTGRLILYSATLSATDPDEARRNGFDAIVMKPADKATIAAQLAEEAEDRGRRSAA